MKRLIYLIMAVLLFNVVAALDLYSDRLNVPITGTNHTQTVTVNGNVSVTIPSGWSIIAYSPSGVVGFNEITFANVNSSVFYTIESPGFTKEGTTWKSEVAVNGVKEDEFIFVGVEDSTIVNCKSELGHGDANWLDTVYLPAESTIQLFNMVRVFPLSSYYNEEATNASISCVFPEYHVLVSQGTEGSWFEHGDTNFTANIYWENLWRNWFRVAPIGQEITPAAIGENYTVTCGEMRYSYSNGDIVVPEVGVCLDYEFRDPEPFNVSFRKPCADLVTLSCGDYIILGDNCENPDCIKGSYIFTVTNQEEYTVYDTEFKWSVGEGETITRNIREIPPGTTLVFYVGVEGTGVIRQEISFTPEWYKNALSPHFSKQVTTSAFQVSNGTGSIVDASLAQMLEGNKVIMSDNDDILAGEKYRARLMVHDFFGNPMDPDETPKIRLIDPTGATIVPATYLTKESTGVYRYEYTTLDSEVNGVWEAITTTVVNGQTITRNDYWELQGNPAQVQIQAVDKTVPSIVCRITIQNEGGTSQEYNFKYWVSSTADGQFSENTTIDSGSAAKLIEPGDIYVTDKTFNVPNPGEYWCKVLVSWDTSSSAASDKFVAVRSGVISQPAPTCFNGIDDDRDGLIDSLDPDCSVTNREGGTLFFLFDADGGGPWIWLLLLLLLILFFVKKNKENRRRRNYIDIPYR